MRWIIVFIIVACLIAWGGLLEESAESNARDFCAEVIVGSSYLGTLEKARTIGEDQLRIISKDSIVVGFTGIPPFSRHLCEISPKGDEVGEKRYIYLD